MHNDLEELRERVSLLDDGALLRMIGEEAGNYRPEALEVAREEAKRRGIDANQRPVAIEDLELPSDEGRDEDRKFEQEKTEEEQEEEEEEEEEEERQPTRGFLCSSCGTGMRRAFLLGDTQVIAVLEPNKEQRFVYAMVCPRCGTADLFVDFETEVEE